MKIRVLGCSGAIAKDCRTTSFLLNDNVLVDAGTGVGDLTLEELARIDHVFLSHSHMDHVCALPLMLDSVGGLRSQPVQVHALPATLDALQRHLFNDIIWPDFARLPQPQAPFLTYRPIQVGQPVHIPGIVIEPLPAEHSVPAVGFAARGTQDARWWVYSGDTGGCAAFWQRVNTLPVGALVIEAAFSEQEADLARRSQHLTPNTLLRELQHIPAHLAGTYPIYITHTKPSAHTAIMQECQHLLASPFISGHQPLQWLSAGTRIDL